MYHSSKPLIFMCEQSVIFYGLRLFCLHLLLLTCTMNMLVVNLCHEKHTIDKNKYTFQSERERRCAGWHKQWGHTATETLCIAVSSCVLSSLISVLSSVTSSSVHSTRYKHNVCVSSNHQCEMNTHHTWWWCLCTCYHGHGLVWIDNAATIHGDGQHTPAFTSTHWDPFPTGTSESLPDMCTVTKGKAVCDVSCVSQISHRDKPMHLRFCAGFSTPW